MKVDVRQGGGGGSRGEGRLAMADVVTAGPPLPLGRLSQASRPSGITR